MNKQTRTVLLLARDFVKSGWVKGYSARKGPEGVLTSAIDKDASCFCLGGAIERACYYTGQDTFPTWDLVNKEIAKLGTSAYSIVTFNDHERTTRNDVINLIDQILEQE